MQKINNALWDNAMSYETYWSFINQTLQARLDASAPQPVYTEAMLHYIQLNAVRMARLDKTIELTETAEALLQQLKQPVAWLVITEPWCGDAAQSVPALQKIAAASPLIALRFILRDQHLDIMDAFLTNGARSIPKVLIINTHTHEVLGTWGPRPAALQDMALPLIAAMKAQPDKALRAQQYEALKIEAQRWYNRNKTFDTQQEILQATLATLPLAATGV